MSSSGTKRKSSANDERDGSIKKTICIKENNVLKDVDFQNKLKEVWEKTESFSGESVSLENKPFRHGEIRDFIGNPDFLDEFTEKFSTFDFQEKASDLFQFKQSNDLKSYVDPHIYKIMEYLSTEVKLFLQNITGIPLNEDIDLFLSEYQQTDFLLCHDDELDSRRIAFILYLSKDWKPEFGGNLDLFSSTEDIHPGDIIKSVTPEFNKFVFFEVVATSFHQVSEVTEPDVSRFALSGWFYGDPVPRPKIVFPKHADYALEENMLERKGILKQMCSDGYLSSNTYTDINEQLTEESQVLIPGFLQENVYKSICSDIVEQDVSKSLFEEKVGPPNISCYHETNRGPLNTSILTKKSESKPPIFGLDELIILFHSEEFLELMEKITEFPFTSYSDWSVVSSLRKYSKGSYTLLRSGGAKQTGESSKPKTTNDDDNESFDDTEEEEPNFIDVIYFFASKWDERWGGLTIYSAEDGEQLITIPPEGNCMAVVVRNSTVNSYVNYVNSLAKDEVFFSYNMTFSFQGKL